MRKNFSLNKTWFRRLLFSYVTIFLLIVPLLMIILLMAFSELSRKTAVESNEIFTKQLLQSIDNQMKLIDNTITNEIASDDDMLSAFFNPALRDDRYYSGYLSSLKVKSLMATMPLIDSIYLYRLSDNTVQTPYSVSKLAVFNDKQLIVEALQASGLNQHQWTNVRKGYTEQGEPSEVVSLVRYVPLNSGNDGLIVVNVQLQAIAHFVQTLTTQKSNHLSLSDREGTPIYGDVQGNDALMMEMHSDYSGWAIKSSVANGNLFRLVSAISKYWILVCAIFFSIGVVWIVVVTRRNYKPVETIIQRIQLFSQQKSAELFRKGNQDEFKFIDTALVNLMEQSNAYQKQHEEDLIFKRKHFFFEWMDGNRPLQYEEWHQEMESLRMPSDFVSLCVSVLEINKHSTFTSLYSEHDQNLLKFVLSSVVKEIAIGRNVTIWSEWTSKDQLTILHQVHSPEIEPEQIASDMANDMMQWVQTYLDFNITMGIGSGVDRIELVHYAYAEALEALEYKPSLGEDRVICYWQIKPDGKQQSLDLLEYIPAIAFSLRTGEDDWQNSFAQLFDGIRRGLYARKELDNLMSYMIFFIDKEFKDLPTDVQKIWTNGVKDKLQKAVDDWETVDELQFMLRNVLTETSEAIAALREMSSHYILIRKIKGYMEEHYHNPDLSLLHLSEVFHVHMKSISRTFKEEIGENFIDYLTRIRTEHAKELLVHTEHSIQEITIRIGYLHPNTFIRSFKKLVGQTPGDFRKTAQVKS
ncbi:helix-turn-helix domain-containing protein [Paenibacillus sp. HWE-109]|uniref:helix-turn-helix domain-containing protein n=1 Tax=Paenibacillus sp. HWE-109 TaxID=1306526 RepID=UPI001EDD17F6|nr:helix-turn-helix domain-containing protein [Paenibacillus sp. HWE-109]UKS28482.1 helix-turn-helix domain-containing protein [Paenibacillus sp. HWE-109]